MRKTYARFVATMGMAAAVAMMFANPAWGQDKANAAGKGAEEKRWEPKAVLFDNGKVRVQEVTFRPGDEGPNAPRPFRVIRVLEGGPIQRTFPDGRTDVVVYKAGETRVYEADKPFVPRNVGKTPIVLFVVSVKEP